jgi:hypothetical protein
MDALTVFLRDQARRPMVWGVSDCLLTPADWLVHRGLPDPASRWRGTYDDEVGAEAILSAHGGVVALMRAGLDPTGARELTHGVRQARGGDVAAVRIDLDSGPVIAGAIRTSRRWAVRAPRGLWFGRAEALAVWRLEV